MNLSSYWSLSSFGVKLLMVSMGLFWLNSDVVVYQTLCYSTERVYVYYHYCTTYKIKSEKSCYIQKKDLYANFMIYRSKLCWTNPLTLVPVHTFSVAHHFASSHTSNSDIYQNLWQVPSDSNYWLWLRLPQS